MTVLLADRYRTTDLLGVGGTASVYRAHDCRLHRDVAVKIFNATTSDDDAYRRQHTETILLTTLNHPGLVTVHDAGMHKDPEGRTAGYLVMEFVDGEDLRHLLQRGALPADVVAQLGADMADALAYIHSEGVIHRDVKPANILLFYSSDHGTRLYPKLTDFGIARVVEAASATAVGATIGTANYLSPEQAKGDPLDRRSDIYSLGLVLLECLLGEKSFPGPVVEAALARLLRDPDVPDSLGSDWVRLLRQMTARDPLLRPDAHEVALRLRSHDDAPFRAGVVDSRILPALPGAIGGTEAGDLLTGGVFTGSVHIPAPPSRAPSIH